MFKKHILKNLVSIAFTRNTFEKKKPIKINLRIKRFDVNSSFNSLFILINYQKGRYVNTHPCWLSNTHTGVTCKMKWSYKTESIAVLWKHIYINVMRITFCNWTGMKLIPVTSIRKKLNIVLKWAFYLKC